MDGVRVRNFDFNKLMDFTATAQGSVFLKTDEGDVLNLRSQLTGLLLLSGALEQGLIRDATVMCGDKSDEARLFRADIYRK
jgi:hypothetical protein